VLEARRRKAEAERRAAERYRDDPNGWVTNRLGEHLWSKQQAVAASVAANRRTAVRSCNGAGKTRVASRLATWWVDTRPVGEAIVVSTAPTFGQVRAALWQEIGDAHRKGGLVGDCHQTEWWSEGVLLGFGRTPAHYDPTAFQGIHRRYVLVILDEACGIPKDLWVAAGALATNDDSRVLAIGNPDDPSSHFASVCQEGSGWSVLGISAFDSPNFTGEPLPPGLAELLVGPVWVEEQRMDVGEDSPVWESKVLGRFPAEAEDSVVRWSALVGCHRAGQHHEVNEPVELGVDVGAGGDQTVVVERRGPVAGRMWRRFTPDRDQVVALVLHAIAETGATTVKVDAIGIGWDIAADVGKTVEGVRTVPVNVGSASSQPYRFPRLRDQIWWEVGRRLTEDGAWDLSKLPDSTLTQLASPRYALDASGRVKVEPKDETRKRLGRSPDEADALLLAFYSPVRRQGRMVHAGRAA